MQMNVSHGWRLDLASVNWGEGAPVQVPVLAPEGPCAGWSAHMVVYMLFLTVNGRATSWLSMVRCLTARLSGNQEEAVIGGIDPVGPSLTEHQATGAKVRATSAASIMLQNGSHNMSWIVLSWSTGPPLRGFNPAVVMVAPFSQYAKRAMAGKRGQQSSRGLHL